MKIKSFAMGIIILLVIFGGIGATIATDLWTTTTDKKPAKFTSGEFEGKYNPADIRGSYTFLDVSKAFEIDLAVLYKAFGIPQDTDGTKIKTKDLETLYSETGFEIGNESVQIFVALYKNLPITMDETLLPSEAVKLILHENSSLNEEQTNYLETHGVDVQNIKDIDVIEDAKDESNGDEEIVINGSTTFQKVLDAGVTKKQIEELIDAPMPPTNQTVKDYCNENGLSFSEIKEKLNALIQ